MIPCTLCGDEIEILRVSMTSSGETLAICDACIELRARLVVAGIHGNQPLVAPEIDGTVRYIRTPPRERPK